MTYKRLFQANTLDNTREKEKRSTGRLNESGKPHIKRKGEEMKREHFEKINEVVFDLEQVKTLLDNAIFEDEKDLADLMMIDAKQQLDDLIDELEKISADLGS